MVQDNGLEGVVVASTRLSDVDGANGRLIIGGHDVEQLAERASFEETFGLLWDGTWPDAERLKTICAGLGSARVTAFELLGHMAGALRASDGMEALRATLAQLWSKPTDERLDAALELAGAAPVLAAAWARLQKGEPAVAPEATLGHAADYLRMVTGRAPADALARALDSYLVTVSDHGMNASTFAARVVASTGSDTVSSVVAAVGALKGPLHGGAPGPVLDMLDDIGSPERATTWLETELKAGRRIMGMGHRIYRVRDPRAAVLESATQKLERAGVSTGRLTLARAVEAAAVGILRTRYPDRPLHANVEFYTAVLLDSVGLDRRLFTPTFTIGRIAGWLAHVKEQRATGRLIRPASRYVGPQPVAT